MAPRTAAGQLSSPRAIFFRRLALRALLGALPLLMGCAAPRPLGPPHSIAALVAQGRAQSLDLQDPFALDPAIEAVADREIGRSGSPHERLMRILRYLNDHVGLAFRYRSNLTLTARQAFERKQGNCLAYTNLIVGLARYLGVPAYFIHVQEPGGFYEKGGLYYVASHMAVGYGGPDPGSQSISPEMTVVDLNSEVTDWAPWTYEPIDDVTAFGLFYNNIAVNRMEEGDLGYARKLMLFLIRNDPGLKEVYNNLGVLYNRSGRYHTALHLFQEAMRRFPNYQPLYPNAVDAANGAGDFALVRRLQERETALRRKDPLLYFTLGVERFTARDYPAAAQDFRRAIRAEPPSPILYAWLSRALLSDGQVSRGRSAYAKARELDPTLGILPTLRRQFPVLENPPSAPASGSRP
ncbi:MAG: tetratricopeptide repeat protein [Acidobacteriota bacterium]